MVAKSASDVTAHQGTTVYPDEFASRVAGREKRRLGDAFNLKHFGVNLTTLAPGAQSALLHRHTVQDEFIYVLEGEATLITDDGVETLKPGQFAGFPGGGHAHHLVNRSNTPVRYLEIGDRLPGDDVTYPEDDLAAKMGIDGKWVMTRKDGSSI